MAALRWDSTRLLSCILLAFCALARSYVDAKGENNGCSAVKQAFGLKEYVDEVPSKMISGEHLRICPPGFTCCTHTLEGKLRTESKKQFDEVMGRKIKNIRQLFITRTATFDAFFKELLDNSRRDLHDMFVKTYGLLYQQNSHVFTDLFDDLRNYYKGSNVDLMRALDKFFETLMQKMFQLLNSQYVFDEAYLQCITEHMEELQPFDTVPQKLSVQVKRAFVAARTFAQALAVGRDVILAASKLEPSDSCQQAVMKMVYCPYCKGLPHLKPCNRYCMNVMRGCLAFHADLNVEWNNYLEAMRKVADRLEGPFNIESVVEPIDVKISGAIMNLQWKADQVTENVFTGCGRPRLESAMARKKRQVTDPAEPVAKNKRETTDTETYDDYNHYDQDQSVRPTTAAGTSLDRLVRDIKKKLEMAEDFWHSLPDSLCNEMAAPIDDEFNCWNGLGKSKYVPMVMSDGVYNQVNNPEVEVDVRKPNTVIGQQILKLKLITTKLDQAYHGQDVDWVESEFGIHHGHDGAPGPSHNKPADKPTHHKKPDRKHGYTNYYSGEESYTGGSGSGDYGGSGSGSGDGSRPGFDDDDRGKYDFTNKNKKPVPPVRKPPPKSDKEDDYNNVNKPAGFGSSAHRALSPSVTVLLVLPALVCLLVRFLPTVR